MIYSMNLSQEDAQLFFDLMWGLQRYANQRGRILKDFASPMEYGELPAEKKIKVRDALWKNPGLIDDYVKENPESLAENHLEIIRSWKRFIKGEFFILRHLKRHTIFIGNKDQVYGVLGLFDPLEDIVPGFALPVVTETVLLPFKGWIVYDGLLKSYAISFGGGIRSDLNHTYMAAKQKDRIITTLEPGTNQPKSGTQKIVKSWLPQLEEIASTASKLKGDTSLQKATISLLHSSIELAKCAETHPEDLDMLFAAERKMHNAVNRLMKVLDIEAED